MAAADFSVDALVIRELPSGDNDKLLTLLTAERGRFNVIAKGARSLHSRFMAASRGYVWGNFEIHRKGADSCWLRDASVTEAFPQIGRDIAKTYLAQYICDVCCELSGLDVPGEDMLRLALNSLYAVSREIKPEKQVKAVFEWRAAACSGYMPDLSGCRTCGTESSDAFYLDVMNGSILCAGCIAQAAADAPAYGELPPTDRYGTRSILLPLRPNVLAALRYLLEVPVQNMLSFGLSDPQDMSDFLRICETYLLSHLERDFSSLKYYNEVSKI